MKIKLLIIYLFIYCDIYYLEIYITFKDVIIVFTLAISHV